MYLYLNTNLVVSVSHVQTKKKADLQSSDSYSTLIHTTVSLWGCPETTMSFGKVVYGQLCLTATPPTTWVRMTTLEKTNPRKSQNKNTHTTQYYGIWGILNILIIWADQKNFCLLNFSHSMVKKLKRCHLKYWGRSSPILTGLRSVTAAKVARLTFSVEKCCKYKSHKCFP